MSEVHVSWDTPAGLNIAKDAFVNEYQITLYVPLGTTANYQSRSPWNNFKEIKEYVPGGNEGKEKCEVPTIGVEENVLTFRSATPGAKYYYTVTCDDQQALTGSEDGRVELSATYRITAYAYADDRDNSEMAEAVLVWVTARMEGDNVIAAEARKAIVLRSNGRALTVCGTERGEQVALYSLGGIQLCSATARDGETTLPCQLQKGQTYVVKYGDRAVKYRF